MDKEFEALKTIKIKCHPNSNPSPIVDEALETVEEALNDKQDLERFTRLLIDKSFNFDRFRYALTHWDTIEEQLDVYNSGIGSVYDYDKEDFTFIKEMIAKYGKGI